MKIKTILAPPTFEKEEEKTFKAILLNSSIWTIIALLTLTMAYNTITGITPPLANFFDIAMLALCLVARQIMFKGYLKTASILLMIVGISHITSEFLQFSIVRTPALMGLILIIFIAGLQFSRRGITIITIGISLILLGLILAEQNSLLPEPDISIGITQWISYSVALVFTGNITLLGVDMIRRSLGSARQELKKLKASDEILRIFSLAIEHNPASIMITDKNGLIQNVNPKFTQITGYKAEEAIGKNPRILKSGEQSRSFYKVLWNTINSGQEWHGEFHNKKKNGELYWERASISSVVDEKGVITHFVAVKEDVTEQKKTNDNLKEANRLLQAQLNQINELQASLREQATRDSLTGLHNRRYFDEILQKEFARAKRECYPISLVAIDLDNLKRINDTGGHPTGDKALRDIASHLRTLTRAQDTVCRLGGDEFSIIMPNIFPKDAFKRTEEALSSTPTIKLDPNLGEWTNITFTAGIASFPEHGETVEEIVKFADIALYRAKAEGRNRVEIYVPKDKILN